MKYLYTKSDHYKIYVSENKTDRICKGCKILPYGSGKYHLIWNSLGGPIREEIFKNPIITNYQVVDINNFFRKVLFKSTSNTEYRIDIHLLNEVNGLVNHIAFTENDDKFDTLPTNDLEADKYESDYHKLTGRDEMIEVMDRIHYILMDLINKNIISNNFCIGGTEIDKKNNIYEYFLKVMVGEDGFKKLPTNAYPKIGWGLYFKM